MFDFKSILRASPKTKVYKAKLVEIIQQELKGLPGMDETKVLVKADIIAQKFLEHLLT